jgi:hypothetical protein
MENISGPVQIEVDKEQTTAATGGATRKLDKEHSS